MGKCILLNDCAFYNNRLSGMIASSRFLKSVYCLDNSLKCARRKIHGTISVEENKNNVDPLGFDILTCGTVSRDMPS